MTTAAGVPSERRFAKGSACPVCGGRESDPRGEGKRCTGFVSSDGTYAHCSREEHAGGIALHPKTSAYPHKLHGPCKCGTQHGEAEATGRREVAKYDYLDEQGNLLFQCVRFEPKKFMQRRPLDNGAWDWSLKGVRRVLFRLPKLLAPEMAGEIVLVVEGEKDVLAAERLGFLATCNPMGAGKWQDSYTEALKGHAAYIVPDTDEPGRRHAAQVLASLQHAGIKARILYLPAKDLAAWVDTGGTREALNALIEGQPAAAALERRARLVDSILARAREPWVQVRVGDQTIIEIPPGGHVVLDGPTGSGKTALAVNSLATHAKESGPAIYVSLELQPDVIAARAIGSALGVTWDRVLKGDVGRDAMVGAIPERLMIVDGSALEMLTEIAMARETWPRLPLLLCVDYIQLAAIGDDMRAGVAQRIEALRVLAEKERVVMLVVSQPSRAAAKELRAGDMTGAQTIGVSAESAQVERGATATIAIGGIGIPDERGWTRIDLSIGKGRYGGGDKVWPAKYHGASGQWKIDGTAQAASDVRASREAERNEAKLKGIQNAVIGAASKAKAPLTIKELLQEVRGNKALLTLAVKNAVRAEELVECPPRPRTNYPTYWTPEKQAKVKA